MGVLLQYPEISQILATANTSGAASSSSPNLVNNQTINVTSSLNVNTFQNPNGQVTKYHSTSTEITHGK